MADGIHASEIWEELDTARKRLGELRPLSFLRSTEGWIESELLLPLDKAITSARDAINVLDDMASDDDELGGLCFIARAEIAEGRRALNLVGRSRDERLVAAEASQSRIVRALDAVLAQTGRPPLWDPEFVTRTAISVRARYGALRTAVEALESVEIGTAIHRLAEAIDALVRSEAWAHVRLSDHFVVEQLRRRVSAWSGDELEGKRLVSDALATVSLFGGINLRPELRRSDETAARRALELLPEARQNPEAMLEVQKLLSHLEGRDPRLDSAIPLFRAGVPVGGRVRAALERIRQELEGAPESSAGGF